MYVYVYLFYLFDSNLLRASSNVVPSFKTDNEFLEYRNEKTNKISDLLLHEEYDIVRLSTGEKLPPYLQLSNFESPLTKTEEKEHHQRSLLFFLSIHG